MFWDYRYPRLLTDEQLIKVKKSHPRFERAGIHCAEIVDQHQLDQRPLESFDHVVADVPCSGTGTIRRNPDLPWRLTLEGLLTYPPLQQSILEKGASFVKKGGALSYMTCSLLREENEGVIEGVLKTHPQFERTSLKKLSPGMTGTDGFFFTLLTKKNS